MVETYKRTSNPMMNRPVVKAELVEWMRSSQTQITGELAEVLKFAKENNIPVIPHETVYLFSNVVEFVAAKKNSRNRNSNWFFGSHNGSRDSKCGDCNN